MIPYQLFNRETLFDELQQHLWAARGRQLEEARAENARLKADFATSKNQQKGPMKHKLKTLLAALLLACGLFTITGCGTVQKVISPELVREGTAASVSYSAEQWPDAVPGIRIGQEVICSAANGTDISPTKIIADVKLITDLKPQAKWALTGAMFLYTAAWNSYGEDAVNKVPELKLYLQATCDGITDGLPGAPAAALKSRAPPSATQWPMVR